MPRSELEINRAIVGVPLHPVLADQLLTQEALVQRVAKLPWPAGLLRCEKEVISSPRGRYRNVKGASFPPGVLRVLLENVSQRVANCWPRVLPGRSFEKKRFESVSRAARRARQRHGGRLTQQ